MQVSYNPIIMEQPNILCLQKPPHSLTMHPVDLHVLRIRAGPVFLFLTFTILFLLSVCELNKFILAKLMTVWLAVIL